MKSLIVLSLLLSQIGLAQELRKASPEEIKTLLTEEMLEESKQDFLKARVEIEYKKTSDFLLAEFDKIENEAYEDLTQSIHQYFQNRIKSGLTKKQIQGLQRLLTTDYMLLLEEKKDFSKDEKSHRLTQLIKVIDTAGKGLDFNIEATEQKTNELHPQVDLYITTKTSSLLDDNAASCSKVSKSFGIENLINGNKEFIDLAQSTQIKKPAGMLYISWGYNRSWHSLSDVTFKTSEGTFTIKDAKGYDRPSPLKSWDDFLVYVNPSKMSIPQYNIQIGYMFNDKWGIEAGQDHMKYVFDNSRKYEVTGDFSAQLLVPNENANYDWDVIKMVDFDYIKEHGDLSWLNFEHTDGYNYVHMGGVYQTNLAKLFNDKLTIDARFGAGAGLMIPKTKVTMHRDAWWNHVGNDNRFHIAGYGVHGDTRLKVTLKDKVYLQATGKATVVKMSDALVYTNVDPDARFEHTPITSFQFMVQVGYQIKLKGKKRKKVPKSIY